MSFTYICAVNVPLMTTVKKNGTSDHNSWFRACIAYSNESRISTLPWASSNTSLIIVRTQLEAGFVVKSGHDGAKSFPTHSDQHLLIAESLRPIWRVILRKRERERDLPSLFL
ncbi:hypothetical protein TNCV_2761051 [Trichonephila clavipes]|nr:hypothetical protein TNCV_2761051 [Trichonephila clavipes]